MLNTTSNTTTFITGLPPQSLQKATQKYYRRKLKTSREEDGIKGKTDYQ
jgi:hypothetical protein